MGYGRKRRSLHDIMLWLYQFGSMASRGVYAGVFGAVLARLPTVDVRVAVLYGIQLGGGTDIDRVLAYCQGIITKPEQTIVVLISDLY